jgi:DNA-binding transcriptional ArsR family regulator
MDVEEKFISVSGLICEPTRAKMLWNLLDGRAYTASELSHIASISATAASNHLARLLEADIVKVEMQGRHRYYSFSNPAVAYVVEALANFASSNSVDADKKEVTSNGIKFCRTCYDHLAGYVGVRVVEALEQDGYIKKAGAVYNVSTKGWTWFSELGISKNDFVNNRRPLTRLCLDWSERRPHLAGQLGAKLLEKMLQRKWFRRVQFGRELIVTSMGRKELNDLLGISI